MREIPLTKGKVAFVDDADFEELNQFSWYVSQDTNSLWYAVRNITVSKNKRTIVRMHRIIMNITDPKIKVDHVNHNGLDNRRENLRVCTQRQNMQNQRKRSTPKTSQFKGVSFNKGMNLWKASIGADGEHRHIGFFQTEEQAARAYDEAAIRLHGQFANLNFPDNSYHIHTAPLVPTQVSDVSMTSE